MAVSSTLRPLKNLNSTIWLCCESISANLANASSRINPQFADAYSNRGNALQDKGDLRGSIADYESAIKIDPSFAKAYGNRGLARLSQGDMAEAEKDFDACLRLDPGLKRSLEEQIEQ